MENKEIRIRICPICKHIYSGVPAVSRTDNKTPICLDCGTRQALESLGGGCAPLTRAVRVCIVDFRKGNRLGQTSKLTAVVYSNGLKIFGAD